jgi:AcrR family transcriptional regulator
MNLRRWAWQHQPAVSTQASAPAEGDQVVKRRSDIAPDPLAPAGAARRAKARRGEGDRLRTEIIDAASAALAATGEVADLSLRAVARAVGVATTSLYLHFASLDDLVLAVKIRYFDEFGTVLDAAANAAGDAPLTRSRARAHAYVTYGLRNPGVYRVLFLSEARSPQSRSALRHLGVELFDAVRDEIAQIAGPHDNPEMLAVHFWTGLHGVVTLRTTRPTFPWPDIDAEIDDLIDRLLPTVKRAKASGRSATA